MSKRPGVIKLSVNVNKIAWLRNARAGDRPDVVAVAQTIIDAGAQGITVHPRPDQRHITARDTRQLAALITNNPQVEYNIEGNPSSRARKGRKTRKTRKNGYPGFAALIEECRPTQATLVPDSDSQLTSDHGFDLLHTDNMRLKRQVRRCQAAGARVSLFMDPEPEQIKAARDCGVERIELYTGPYAEAFLQHGEHGQATQREFARHVAAAEQAATLGLGINAGHDLDQANLVLFKELPGLAEVSIGHALVADALEAGLATTVAAYLQALV